VRIYCLEEVAPMDDIEIIESVQAGQREAFSLLVEKYHRHLLNFIYRLVRDEQIVEDIGQDVFFNVYKSIKSFNTKQGVPFSAWLFITARNRCISELRKKNRAGVSLDLESNFPAREKNAELFLCEEERLNAIHNALEQLPEPYKSTLMESLKGDSLGKIALNNKISLGTAKSRLFRARKKLRLLLRASFGGDQI
jgi:RNA polymerase sigma-70 factor, ECF subfamily